MHRIKFESGMEVLINEFCDFIVKHGYNKDQKKYYKNALDNFNWFISGLDVRDLTQVTRAMACSQFLRYLNKGFRVYRRYGGAKRNYPNDYSFQIKEFFMFLHTHKNISNPKVLKALCSKEELKDLKIK